MEAQKQKKHLQLIKKSASQHYSGWRRSLHVHTQDNNPPRWCNKCTRMHIYTQVWLRVNVVKMHMYFKLYRGSTNFPSKSQRHSSQERRNTLKCIWKQETSQSSHKQQRGWSHSVWFEITLWNPSNKASMVLAHIHTKHTDEWTKIKDSEINPHR